MLLLRLTLTDIPLLQNASKVLLVARSLTTGMTLVSESSFFHQNTKIPFNTKEFHGGINQSMAFFTLNVVGFQKHNTRAMSHIPRFSEAHVSDSSCMACRSCLMYFFILRKF